ncbi:hypothetical protein WJX73_010328 [Symbiochloris irregularis]|uniref:Progestin and adipoQ receptor family member 4 n=1 Tax=Symbiochloris irregularis TaxID=706552 RepID=A0AAW1PCC7_9CHLO
MQRRFFDANLHNGFCTRVPQRGQLASINVFTNFVFVAITDQNMPALVFVSNASDAIQLAQEGRPASGSQATTSARADFQDAPHAPARHKSGRPRRALAKTQGQNLYWFEDAPADLQFNRYIRSGYRAGLSYGECVCSVFQYHNETGNIWAHFVPLLCILISLLSRTLRPWPTAQWAFYENVAPIALVFGASVLYHTFMAHHTTYRKWLLLDMCGVFLVFIASMHRLLDWGFPCHPQTATLFTVLYYSSAVGCIIAGLKATTALHRGLPLGMLFLVRLTALLTRKLLNSGAQDSLHAYAIMEACTVTGATLNVLRVPERWLQPQVKPRTPGLLDYWLNSHQLMHILVTVSMLQLHRGASIDYAYWASQPQCPA